MAPVATPDITVEALTIPPPFTELLPVRAGRMVVLSNDEYITPCLREHGEYSSGEQRVFKRFVDKSSLVVEVGANMGAHTLALAGLAGTVVAFEPQRIVFQVLCGNLALNSVANVVAIPAAVGEQEGRTHIPFASPWHHCNYGGIQTGDAGESVPVRTLDAMNLPALDFLKLDCEGAELRVLIGARETIRKYQPVIYLEFEWNRDALVNFLHALGYRMWRHFPRHAPGSPWHSDMLLAAPARWTPDQDFLASEGFMSLTLTNSPTTMPAEGGDAGSNAGGGRNQVKGV